MYSTSFIDRRLEGWFSTSPPLGLRDHRGSIDAALFLQPEDGSPSLPPGLATGGEEKEGKGRESDTAECVKNSVSGEPTQTHKSCDSCEI